MKWDPKLARFVAFGLVLFIGGMIAGAAIVVGAAPQVLVSYVLVAGFLWMAPHIHGRGQPQ
jgi:hypothetical protein